MKKIILIFCLVLAQSAMSQSYHLLPDSCTFCMHLSSTGGSSWYNNYYQVMPDNDTLFGGNNYMKVAIDPTASSYMPEQPFAYRQFGNQLFGIVHDSINEFLIMDFDAEIDDTIYNLYSEGFLYNAKVITKDSVLVNNGVYHHFIQLEGYNYFDGQVWINTNWELTWNERALCGYNNTGWGGESLGGLLYNVPSNFYTLSTQYTSPVYCTTDPLYDTSPDVSCDNCLPQTSSLSEIDFANALIYPNPAKNQIDIRIQDNSAYNIEIVDINGQIHYSFESLNGSESIDISNLESGIYFVHLFSKGHLITKKFVKE